MLEKQEIIRYNRQMILPEIGTTGQLKLKQSRVLVIGAGGLGCPVLQYLVAAGVGRIGIADNDRVDLSNLQRQVLYGFNDIGKLKSEVARERLQAMNPHIQIDSYPLRIDAENIESIIGQYELIIDGSDNFPTRYLVSDACVALRKPLIFGSIFKFEAQLSLFNYHEGPSYRDLFPEPPDAGSSPSCSEIGVIGALPGIAGSLMATEAIKVICQVGNTLSGKLMTINALDNAIQIFNISKTKHTAHPPKTVVPETTANGEIHAEKLARWMRESPDEICIIDVRESYEFENINIGGINIPLAELPGSSDELPSNKRLILCCQSGQRSRMALDILRPLLEGEIFHLKGGLNAYFLVSEN